MEALLPFIIQLIAGGVGGNGIAQALKQVNLGPIGNTIAGAVGGVGGTALAGAVPGLDALAGMGLAGDGIAGLVGGGVLTAIAGFVKNKRAS